MKSYQNKSLAGRPHKDLRNQITNHPPLPFQSIWTAVTSQWKSMNSPSSNWIHPSCHRWVFRIERRTTKHSRPGRVAFQMYSKVLKAQAPHSFCQPNGNPWVAGNLLVFLGDLEPVISHHFGLNPLATLKHTVKLFRHVVSWGHLQHPIKHWTLHSSPRSSSQNATNHCHCSDQLSPCLSIARP